MMTRCRTLGFRQVPGAMPTLAWACLSLSMPTQAWAWHPAPGRNPIIVRRPTWCFEVRAAHAAYSAATRALLGSTLTRSPAGVVLPKHRLQRGIAQPIPRDSIRSGLHIHIHRGLVRALIVIRQGQSNLVMA